jgi:hypothetical protein
MNTSDESDKKPHHPPLEANEFFYIDKDGQKSDRALHEPILDGISREARERYREATYQRAREEGWSEEDIRETYGNPGDPEDPDELARLRGLSFDPEWHAKIQPVKMRHKPKS